MKIALCMVLKPDKKTALEAERAIQSVYKYVDGIYLTTTAKNKHIENLAQKYNAHLSYTKWEDNFAKLRNFNFAQVPKDYDWIMWLDSDDVVDKPSRIIPTLKKAQDDVLAIIVSYVYSSDEYGNPMMEHPRERILRNVRQWEWRGVLHETIINATDVPSAKALDFKVIHKGDTADHQEKVKRNIKILLKEIERCEKNNETLDARIVYYLALNLKEIGKFEEAVVYYDKFLRSSGWDEHRYKGWLELSDCYIQLNKIRLAIDACLEAIKEKPNFPDAYIKLCEIYSEQGDNERALEWINVALSKPIPVRTTLGISPLTYQYIAKLYKANLLFGFGKAKEAKKIAQEALKIRPKDKEVKKFIKECEFIEKHKEIALSYLKIAKFLYPRYKSKIKELLKAVPKSLEDNPIIQAIYTKVQKEGKTWPKNSIVIYCGQSWFPFAPPILEKGVSGSEEAVIYLARELAKLGWDVTVYNYCQEMEGEYDGVKYINHYRANFEDKFNILVLWRAPELLDLSLKAKKVYLWLHDVIEKDKLPPERLEKLEKVIVLSKYHRSLFPNVPDEKIMVSKNGLNVDDFKAELPKIKNKFIYTSCPSRGLQYLLEIWPEIKKKHPDATLDVYYGWKNWLQHWGNHAPSMKWKERMDKLLKQDGIVFWGMRPQKEVAEAMARSDFYAYPCIFPEISCISLIKSMASGCIPIIVPYGATGETAKYAYKTKGKNIFDEETKKEFKKLVLEAMDKDNEKLRSKMRKYALQNYSWAQVAKEWTEEMR